MACLRYAGSSSSDRSDRYRHCGAVRDDGIQILVTDRSAGEIRRAFSQYLSPSLLHRVENLPTRFGLGGMTAELT